MNHKNERFSNPFKKILKIRINVNSFRKKFEKECTYMLFVTKI